MPNWCANTLCIYGPKKELTRFVETAKGYDQQCKLSQMELRHSGRVNYDEPMPMSHLCFSKFLPVPDGLLERTFGAGEDMDAAEKKGKKLKLVDGAVSMYLWCCDHWGVKWPAREIRFEWLPGEKGVEYVFDTPWGPPEPVIEKMAKMFPKLKFELVYEAEGSGDDKPVTVIYN